MQNFYWSSVVSHKAINVVYRYLDNFLGHVLDVTRRYEGKSYMYKMYVVSYGSLWDSSPLDL